MFGKEPLRADSRLIAKALAVLRIVTALLFLQHGMTKILSWPMLSASDPREWCLLWVAGMLELFGSLFLLAGLFTRWAAFVLAGEMAIAYWMVHAPRGPFPMLNPNPRRGPDVMAPKRISIACSGGTVTKCRPPLPFPPKANWGGDSDHAYPSIH